MKQALVGLVLSLLICACTEMYWSPICAHTDVVTSAPLQIGFGDPAACQRHSTLHRLQVRKYFSMRHLRLPLPLQPVPHLFPH